VIEMQKTIDPDELLPMQAALRAERAVLGSLLVEPETLARVEELREEHFLALRHRLVFRVIQTLRAAGEPITLQTVAYRAWREPGSEMLLPDDFRDMLDEALPAMIHAPASELIGAANLRALRLCGEDLAQTAHAAKAHESRAILAVAQARLGKITGTLTPTGARSALQLSGSLFAKLAGPPEDVIATGFPDLDERLMGGLRRRQMTVIGARPSQGKTTLAINVAANVAAKGRRVLIASLEMADDLIWRNIAICHADVPGAAVAKRTLTQPEWDRMNETIEEIKTWPIEIVDRPDLTAEDLLDLCRSRQSAQPVDLLIVDYLQLLSGTGEGEERVANLSRGVKRIAQALDLAVLCTAQLSRASEARDSRIPQLSDLRGSGQIEQDADVVTLLHRPEAYPGHKPETEGLAHVYVAKNRIGPTGKVTLGFDGSRFRFRPRLNYPSAE